MSVYRTIGPLVIFAAHFRTNLAPILVILSEIEKNYKIPLSETRNHTIDPFFSKLSNSAE